MDTGKVNSAEEAMICVVDGHHGIYAWDSLVSRYPLFVHVEGNHIPLDKWMKGRTDFDGETLKTVFHPDNPEWCENIDYLTTTECLQLMKSKFSYWNIYQGESGDIFAIHPDAEWSDEDDTFILKR